MRLIFEGRIGRIRVCFLKTEAQKKTDAGNMLAFVTGY